MALVGGSTVPWWKPGVLVGERHNRSKPAAFGRANAVPPRFETRFGGDELRRLVPGKKHVG